MPGKIIRLRSRLRDIDLSRDDAPDSILSDPYFNNPFVPVNKTVESGLAVSLYLFVPQRVSRLWFLGPQSSKTLLLVLQLPFWDNYGKFISRQPVPGHGILLPHSFKTRPHRFAKFRAYLRC